MPALICALSGALRKSTIASVTRSHLLVPLRVGSAIDPEESTRKYMSSGKRSGSTTTPPQEATATGAAPSSTKPSGIPPLGAPLEPVSPELAAGSVGAPGPGPNSGAGSDAAAEQPSRAAEPSACQRAICFMAYQWARAPGRSQV